jgi:hypothetical protein
MTRILLARSADIAKTVNPQLSVEAEYGSVVVEGSVYTAAHHQKEGEYTSTNRPAPCNDTNIPIITGDVLVSHFDLDTVGGCMRAMGRYRTALDTEFDGFWNLAEFVDLNGPHKLSESGASKIDLSRLYAFWAWSQANLPRQFPADEVVDVTEHAEAAGLAITGILGGQRDMLEAGEAMRKSQDELNRISFVEAVAEVGIRTHAGFVNHLYTTPEGHPLRAVVALNPEQESVTVSLSEAVEGVSCRELVQKLWGPEAGGHDGIAGSPRDKKMTEEDLRDLGAAVVQALAPLNR